ncbi:MAG: hypothetical protein ACI8W8_001380 [Rhodothermales bacterium]|jgi:hypothetical protein
MKLSAPYAALLLFASLWTALRVLLEAWAIPFVLIVLLVSICVWSDGRKGLFFALLWVYPVLAFLAPHWEYDNYADRFRATCPDMSLTVEERRQQVAARHGYPKGLPSSLLRHYPPPPADAISDFLCVAEGWGGWDAVTPDVKWLFTNVDETSFADIEKLYASDQTMGWRVPDLPEELRHRVFASMDELPATYNELFTLYRFFDFPTLPRTEKDRLRDHLLQLPPAVDDDWWSESRRQRIEGVHILHKLRRALPIYWLHDRHYFDDLQWELLELVGPTLQLDESLFVPAALQPSPELFARIQMEAPYYYVFLLAMHPCFDSPAIFLPELLQALNSGDPLLSYERIFLERHDPAFVSGLVDALGLACVAELPGRRSLLRTYVAMDPSNFAKLAELDDGGELQAEVMRRNQELASTILLTRPEWFHRLTPPLEEVGHEVAIDLIRAEAELRCVSPTVVAQVRLYRSTDFELLGFLAANQILDDRVRYVRLLAEFFDNLEETARRIDALEPEFPFVSSLRDLLKEPPTEAHVCYLRNFNDLLLPWYRMKQPKKNAEASINKSTNDFGVGGDFGSGDFGGADFGVGFFDGEWPEPES